MNPYRKDMLAYKIWRECEKTTCSVPQLLVNLKMLREQHRVKRAVADMVRQGTLACIGKEFLYVAVCQ